MTVLIELFVWRAEDDAFTDRVVRALERDPAIIESVMALAVTDDRLELLSAPLLVSGAGEPATLQTAGVALDVIPRVSVDRTVQLAVHLASEDPDPLDVNAVLSGAGGAWAWLASPEVLLVARPTILSSDADWTSTVEERSKRRATALAEHEGSSRRAKRRALDALLDPAGGQGAP